MLRSLPQQLTALGTQVQRTLLTLSLVRPTIVGMGGGGGDVFSKIQCARSEQAMIYLNVSADRGKTVGSSSIFFVEGKTPEPCTVNVEVYRTNRLMLARCF